MEIAIVVATLVLLVYVLFGFQFVQQDERRVVEMFGGYARTLRPGLRHILPGIMKIRASVKISEQRVPLWEEGVKIDFKDGSATPVGAEVWVQVLSPDVGDPSLPQGIMGRPMTGVERVVYQVSDWRVASRDLVENALRSYLNTLTIDEGITRARAGFDLLNGLLNVNPEEVERLHQTMASWGLKLLRATVGDFDLPAELVKARGQVQVQQRQAEAARYIREQRARETVGTVVQMLAEASGRTFEEVQAEIARSRELQGQFFQLAKDLVTRQISLDSDALTDIRLQGGAGDLGNALAQLIALLKVPLGPGSGAPGSAFQQGGSPPQEPPIGLGSSAEQPAPSPRSSAKGQRPHRLTKEELQRLIKDVGEGRPWGKPPWEK